MLSYHKLLKQSLWFRVLIGGPEIEITVPRASTDSTSVVLNYEARHVWMNLVAVSLNHLRRVCPTTNTVAIQDSIFRSDPRNKLATSIALLRHVLMGDAPVMQLLNGEIIIVQS